MSLPDLLKKAEGSDAIGAFARTSKFMLHPVFNSHHCEMEMQRYIYRLEVRVARIEWHLAA